MSQLGAPFHPLSAPLAAFLSISFCLSLKPAPQLTPSSRPLCPVSSLWVSEHKLPKAQSSFFP